MLPLERILLPVDFSERSPGAAHYARTLACRYHSDLRVLHVLPPAAYPLGAVEFGVSAADALYANRHAQAQHDLSVFVATELPDMPVTRLVAEGDPARKIVAYAHEESVNLIVLPTHGYGPFRRFILGSVTAKILHDAECPVWTGVHIAEAPPAEAITFRHILCALDLGPHSTRTLSWAWQFARDTGANVSIVHATPLLDYGEAAYFDPNWRVMLMNQAKDKIAELQHGVGTQAESFVESGDAAKVVHQFATQLSADLVVIGRSSEAGLLGRLRANAYAIIRESPCPVVSV
ncbi:MAG: universal stress protein [Acidobacteria bacterium]|nr:universal stress protein [Acidobacteriota bacterium]